MPRLRLHYSKDEIINDQYTYGNEWMYEDSTQYLGPYHRYTTGEVYTGAGWNVSISRKLIEYHDMSSLSYRYKQIKSDIQTKYDSFNNYLVELKYDDYITGYVNRYFIKKVNDGVITEISKLTYDDYNGSKIDKNLYTAIQVKWVISGKLETTQTDGITTISVPDQNRKILISAERQMSGISVKLNNLIEYYTNTEFKVPADIN